MFGDAVGCDVGDGLAAGYGESVAGALVSVGFTEQILPVAVPFAGAVGEHDLHLVPAGVRDLVGHPSAAGFRHVRMDDFAVDAVGHHLSPSTRRRACSTPSSVASPRPSRSA